MGSNGKSLFVVLLDKSPRGPLSAEEIELLLAQGIVRRNDLAFRVGEGTWKFLWQFSEFDRRKEAPASEKPKDASSPVFQNDKRKPVSETELREEVHALLPEEIAKILPEDLISDGRTRPVLPRENDLPTPEKESGTPWATNQRTWINLGLAGVLFLAIIYQLAQSPTKSDVTSNESTRAPTAVSVPQSKVAVPQIRRGGPPTGMSLPLSKAVPPSANEKTNADIPRAKDTGEIPLDDYVRKREERYERERKEEEERLKAELKSEEEADKEESKEDSTDEKPKRKKRRVNSEDGDSEETDETKESRRHDAESDENPTESNPDGE